MATTPGSGGLLRLKIQSDHSSFPYAYVKHWNIEYYPERAADNIVEIPLLGEEYYGNEIYYTLSGDNYDITLMPGSFVVERGADQLFKSWDEQNTNNWSGLGNLDTTQAISLSSTFSGCKARSLEGIENWDTSNVKIFEYTFNSVDVGYFNIKDWDVSSADSFRHFFMGAKLNGIDLDLSGWDTSNVSNFMNCFSRLDISDGSRLNVAGWVLSPESDVTNMFTATNAQRFPGIETWDVSNLKTMNSMFANSVSFNQDISSWRPCSTTNMDYMFKGCTAFNQDISNWTVPNISSKHSSFDFESGFEGQTHLQPQWGAECSDPNLADTDLLVVTDLKDGVTKQITGAKFKEYFKP